MNGYIVTIIIAFIFGPILALPVMFFGLFNIMDFALYSFPIFFFCIMGYRQDKRVKDAFKGLIPGLIVSLILTTFVLFVKDQSDCTNKYDSVCLLLCVRDLRDQDLDNGSLNGGAARHGTLQSYCTKTNNMVNF